MIDDTLISVNSTSPTLIKTFRINNANIFNGCNVNISAWNDSASSQTILNLTYNNITYSQSVQSQTEQFVLFQNIPLIQSITPSSMSLYLQTSNSAYNQYSKFFEVAAYPNGYTVEFDDTLVTTTSTSLTAIKQFELAGDRVFTSFNLDLSFWNITSSAITTIAVVYNNITYSQTTSQTSEQFIEFQNIPIYQSITPTSIITYLSTSVSSSQAYSKYFQLTLME